MNQTQDMLKRRIAERVTRLTDGCWQWGSHPRRYPITKVSGRPMSVRRLVYRLLGRGSVTGSHPLGEDEVVVSRCGNPTCVNPDHLIIGAWGKGGLKVPSSPKRTDRYPWEEWFRRALCGSLTLRRGKDYHCSPQVMAQQIRATGSLRGYSISTLGSDVRNGVLCVTARPLDRRGCG